MSTRDTQGSFIRIIWALIGKVKELATNGVPIPPRDDVAADLLLLPVVTRGRQRRQAEEAHLSHMVFRYSSSNPCASSCASSSPLWGR